MANMFWTGSAAAVVKVDTLTVGGTVEADDVFIITMTDEAENTEALSVVAGSTDLDTVAATIAAAFNASTHYMFTPITALALGGASGQLTLTANTAGVPFTATPTTTEDGGGAADDQTFTSASTVANSGPNDWNSLDNWIGDGDLPGADAADVVYVEGDASGNAVIKYGLDQDSIANTLTSLFVTRAQIGENGEDGRPPTYLQIKATTVDINYHSGPSTPVFSSPLNIDTTATASTITVHNTGTNSLSREPSVNILCAEATTDIFVKKGIVGIATHAGETATMDILDVRFVTNRTGDAKVYVGAGVTLDDINQDGGLIELSCGVDTLVTLTGGTLDTTKSKEALTIAAIKIDAPGVYKHNIDKVTLTAKIEPVSATGNVTYTASGV